MHRKSIALVCLVGLSLCTIPTFTPRAQPASQALINDMLGKSPALSGGSCLALGNARAGQ